MPETSSINGEWIAPNPPLHPLHLLESILESHRTSETNTSTTQEERQQEILQVADFLYGNMLTSAMSLLDASERMITKVTATPSNRTLHLVQGSTTPSNRSGAGDVCYLCLVPTQQACNSQTVGMQSIHFCSCRSFWEKSKVVVLGLDKPHSGDFPLCKHLLALKLLPYFQQVQCRQLSTVSDEEFATIVLNNVM
jgi:hypothetical protein